MDRIHRLGQNRPVTVTRLIIENSIESRILELQEKKTAMTSSTLGDDASAMGRLTAQDLEFLVRRPFLFSFLIPLSILWLTPTSLDRKFNL